MTGIRLSQQAQLELERELRIESDAERPREDEQSADQTSPLLREMSGIGLVEEGSLEEAIWRELGALPTSRRGKPVA
jgi:hypothetical protein